ncbi:hypothetical protein [Pseudomonas alkylphenolica]|uniref:hypothetical protein n=1 Tax=Pseudomonas alkylphenolica TaxID=237609 RepID=UPI001E304697|nr:hypothetical protein [Pseudomonas alkylphenolica]
MSNAEPKSPLTIIAIFAGIIEASALASLPFLSEDSQSIYTWFLVGFPFFLTVLFFLTLNFNNKTLFTPPATNLNNAIAPPIAITPKTQDNIEANETMQLKTHTEEDNTPIDNTSLATVAITLSGAKANQLTQHFVMLALNQAESHGTHWVVYNLETGTRTTLNTQPIDR